jgi:RNA polymerase sigma-70 factor (ECF subfamily)
MAAVDRGPGDAALWSRAAHGDHDAFGQLFDRHAGAVYSYLFRLTANWSEAEDLTSAVFLHAWRRRAQVVIDRESSLPWLLGVARRLAQNSSRARRRYQAALARIGTHLADGAPAADPADAVLGRLDSEQRMAQLRAAIARLPRHEREAVELCVWAELDQQAAAVSLGVKVGTVKSRLYRARRRLATELGATGGEPGTAPPAAAGGTMKQEEP